MDTILIRKEDFLKQLEDNPLVTNVREEYPFIYWEEASSFIHTIEDKRELTFVTIPRIQAMYYEKYGEFLNRQTAKRMALDLGYELGKANRKQVFINCVEGM